MLGFLKGTENEGAGAKATPDRVSFKVNTITESAAPQDLSTLELKMGWTEVGIVTVCILHSVGT